MKITSLSLFRVCGLCFVLGLLASPHRVQAADDYVVYSPLVTQGEAEVEVRGFNERAGDPNLDRTGMFGIAAAYSPLSWWKTEYYSGPFIYSPLAGRHLSGSEWENFFQFTEKGAYWADLGFLAAYVQNNLPAQPNSVELGPLISKTTELTQQRLNLIWEKLSGTNLYGRYNFRATYTAGYRYDEVFVPGIEAYDIPIDGTHQVGPGFSGEWSFGHQQTLEYSAAMLFGPSFGTPAHTFVFRISTVF